VRAEKAKWERLNREWKALQAKREDERDVAKRAELNRQVLAKLAERNATHARLVTVNNQWLRIKREWESVGGIQVSDETASGVCECFSESFDHQVAFTQRVDLAEVFDILNLYYFESLSQEEISKIYNVCRGNIGYITLGKSWKHCYKKF
jgi:DNA-directed RNA polymerase specialized sigma subunit